MTVKLNERAFEHAKTLIAERRFVYDERDAWSEHRPSAAKENRFIEEHGFEEYDASRGGETVKVWLPKPVQETRTDEGTGLPCR